MLSLFGYVLLDLLLLEVVPKILLNLGFSTEWVKHLILILHLWLHNMHNKHLRVTSTAIPGNSLWKSIFSSLSHIVRCPSRVEWSAILDERRTPPTKWSLSTTGVRRSSRNRYYWCRQRMSKILMQKSHKKRNESRENIFITEKKWIYLSWGRSIREFLSQRGLLSSCLWSTFT